MSSLLRGYQYDIFISYRHKDNKSDGWVTEFVKTLRSELDATFKEDISIYFDENPHDGLLQHHEVDDSLKEKLRCLVLIPIVSQTYCDPKAFAWQHELLAFIKLASEDKFGLKTKVGGGNTASRVLPVRIHEVDVRDKKLFEEATGGIMRPIDFIYKESGVNRPLRPSDNRDRNQVQTDYRNQVNKVANAIKDIIQGLQGQGVNDLHEEDQRASRDPIPVLQAPRSNRNWKIRPPKFTALLGVSLALAVALVGFAGLAILHFTEPEPDNTTYRASILPPDKSKFSNRSIRNFALSPDGKLLVFLAEDSTGGSYLWVRPIHALSGKKLSGTKDAYAPFWSPDSRSIGFFADGKLKRIEASGGPPQTLCNAPNGRGGAWSAKGTIIFCANNGLESVSRVSASGGSPILVTQLDSGRKERSHRWPHFLPDGEHFLYLSRMQVGSLNDQDAIYMASLDTTFRPRAIVRSSTNPAYANGNLLFTQEQTLMAQPFDMELLQTTGNATAIAEGIQLGIAAGSSFFSASHDGLLVYQAGALGSEKIVKWIDRNDNQTTVLDKASGNISFELRLSPDEKKLAAVKTGPQDGGLDIWLYEISRETWTRLTFDPRYDRWPIWSPDGRHIVYAGGKELILRASSGEGSEKSLLKSDGEVCPEDWSADGRFLTYTVYEKTGGGDIWIMPMRAEEKPFAFLQTKFEESFAAFSPDGRWIAYQSDETGASEIFIRPFPGPGGKWQVSTNGGGSPRWRRDGKELFFLTEGKLMAAEIALGSTAVTLGAVSTLAPIYVGAGEYDVTGDGKRFIYSSRGELQNGTPLTLVVNWPGEIKK